MRQILGRCHCGNIEYEFTWPRSSGDIPVRACSCSFCMKHGAVYTSHGDSRLHARIGDPALVNKYRFGHETADFFVCSGCGVLVFATSVIDGNEYAVINVNTFENVDRSTLNSTVTDFDGEDVPERLARRKRNWTPRVTIEIAGD